MPGPLGKMVFSGQLPSGEVFQYGLHVMHPDSSDLTITEVSTHADTFQNALFTSGTPIGGVYTPQTTWNPPVALIINPSNGQFTEKSFGSSTRAGTASGTVFALPPGVAVCVTLRGNTGAKPIRGRFYLPPPYSGSLQNNGRMSSAAHTTMTGALADAFAALSSGSPSVRPAIYSTTTREFFEAVKGDLGDVFDSMRSRRDKLVEARSSVV